MQETALAVARQVHGLRFDAQHAYADPVRVLSVGAPVEGLLADPSSDGAMTHSVEFCGGT